MTISQVITRDLALPVHFVWVPKDRYRMLAGLVGQEVDKWIRAFAERLGAEIIELNVQEDQVDLLAMVRPKVSISEFMGTIRGRTARRVFNKFRQLKHKPPTLSADSLLTVRLATGLQPTALTLSTVLRT